MDVMLHSITKGAQPDETELYISVGEHPPECFRIRNCRTRRGYSTSVGHIIQRVADLGAEKLRSITPQQVESVDKLRGCLRESDLMNIPQIEFMINVGNVLGAFSCGVSEKFPVRLG
jgi:hypothetical protein